MSGVAACSVANPPRCVPRAGLRGDTRRCAPIVRAVPRDDVASSASAATPITSSRRSLSLAAAVLAVMRAPSTSAAAATDVKASLYDYTVMQYGAPVALKDTFAGKVTVVLNAASE